MEWSFFSIADTAYLQGTDLSDKQSHDNYFVIPLSYQNEFIKSHIYTWFTFWDQNMIQYTNNTKLSCFILYKGDQLPK